MMKAMLTEKRVLQNDIDCRALFQEMEAVELGDGACMTDRKTMARLIGKLIVTNDCKEILVNIVLASGATKKVTLVVLPALTESSVEVQQMVVSLKESMNASRNVKVKKVKEGQQRVQEVARIDLSHCHTNEKGGLPAIVQKRGAPIYPEIVPLAASQATKTAAAPKAEPEKFLGKMERARQIHEYLADFCWRTTGVAAAAAAAAGGAPPAPPGPPPVPAGGMGLGGALGGSKLAQSFFDTGNMFSVAEATYQCPTGMYFKTLGAKTVPGIDTSSTLPLKTLDEDARKAIQKTSPVDRMLRVLATLEQVKLLQFNDSRKQNAQLAATITLVDTRDPDSRQISYPLATKADRQRFWAEFKAIATDACSEGMPTGVAGFTADLSLNRKKNWADKNSEGYGKVASKAGGAKAGGGGPAKRKRKASVEQGLRMPVQVQHVSAVAPPLPAGLPIAASMHMHAAAAAHAAAGMPVGLGPVMGGGLNMVPGVPGVGLAGVGMVGVGGIGSVGNMIGHPQMIPGNIAMLQAAAAMQATTAMSAAAAVQAQAHSHAFHQAAVAMGAGVGLAPAPPAPAPPAPAPPPHHPIKKAKMDTLTDAGAFGAPVFN